MAARIAMTALAAGGVLAVACGSAGAVGWEVTGRAVPTHLAPGHRGLVQLYIYNTSAEDSSGPVRVTDVLPTGVTAESAGYAYNESTNGEGQDWDCSGLGTSVVTCTNDPINMPVISSGVQQPLVFKVNVSAETSGTALNRATVTGGGTSVPASTSDPLVLSSTPAGFGFTGFDGWFTNANGTPDTQAGSHPYELTVSFDLNSVKAPPPYPQGDFGWYSENAGSQVRKIDVNLPPGIIGNPTAVPRCTRQQFDNGHVSSGCPAASQIGVDTPGVGDFGPETLAVFGFPVYNMVPPAGVPAQFAFYISGQKVFLDAGVRSGGDYGISVHVYDLPENNVIFNSITIWGDPAEASHDAQRRGSGDGCDDVDFFISTGHGCAVAASPTPLLTLPTSCAGPQEFTADASTWESPNLMAETSETGFTMHDSNGIPLGFTGCDHLGFGPSLSVAPDTSEADTPAGLTTEVKFPQEGLVSSQGISMSNLRDATVVLPEGVVLNPGRATGLAACPLEDDGVGREGPPSCPSASLVGTAQVSTPLLAHALEGEVYVLQSEPPNVKLLVALAGEGVEVKVVGDVSLNPATGQLTTTFSEAPELPFTDFKLSFSGGAQAALATPTGCGVYTSTSDFMPWSSPFVEDAFPSSSFQVTGGPDGSACASPLPFTPVMTAGATTDQAGGYTDFSLLLQRADGQQRISKLQFKTPTGLLGMISHVSLCGEPQAAKGECPAGSQIGHTIVGAGPGPYPLYVPEAGQPPAPIYITGPYEGAPYGLSIAVPVIAGPFNLGTTVVRGKIEVDPTTSQLTITTDPLPTILDGVPVDMRTINAVIDRKEFMFNPTDCDPQSFSGTATSVEGTGAAISSPFQVGSCRSLAFKPVFKVSTSAKTSRVDGASLHVVLTLPDEGGLSAEANIAKVKVSLPKQLPSPLTTLQKACVEKVFDANPVGCPVASQVGEVKVSTPVLPGGLSGPAYFVSHGGAKYPELILVLTGENGVTVQVHGETFISKAGITTATFAAVPDVPFSSFELTLPQRQYPALTANGNLCKGTLLMPTEMVGQNGLVLDQSTKIAVTGCPKAKRIHHKKKRAKKAEKRR
jgi:hypothetical protein